MPMTLCQAFVAEFEREAAGTRKMLERVPDDKMDWRPHEKSMTLSRLTGHIAEMPAYATSIMGADEYDFGAVEYQPPSPRSKDELLELFDQNCAAFLAAFEGKSDQDLFGRRWKLTNGERVISDLPPVAAIRGFILSHVYHHRGQLSVYLRLLGVELPPIYGPTADG